MTGPLVAGRLPPQHPQLFRALASLEKEGHHQGPQRQREASEWELDSRTGPGPGIPGGGEEPESKARVGLGLERGGSSAL